MYLLRYRQRQLFDTYLSNLESSGTTRQYNSDSRAAVPCVLENPAVQYARLISTYSIPVTDENIGYGPNSSLSTKRVGGRLIRPEWGLASKPVTAPDTSAQDG